ncbi:hypothetical protein PNEG_02953 [Pneumocystis murina B123]|uniref:Uncharacterized protein n=1 Tax=Pneumocystis murina (strain B123) TaxID=1069680 RepID=M7NJL0_PNEMU|nr:hypothetical protein PNEG_02953 [Pneumocystis murina B123]EMR08783.1 hypothetical protein PNEG_02953 [Pneumocystis murina B123]
MANASLKKQARKNKTAIRTLKIGGILSNLFFISIRLIYYYPSTTKYTFIFYFISCFLSTALSFLLWSMGSPKSEKKSLHSFEDLNQKGLVAYMFYTIYITWVVYVFTAIFTDKAWLLYLIPCFLLSSHLLSIIKLFFMNKYIKIEQESINKKVKYIHSL